MNHPVYQPPKVIEQPDPVELLKRYPDSEITMAQLLDWLSETAEPQPCF